MATITGIPQVDLSQFVKGDASQQAAFVEALGKAFTEIGFVGVVNHGIPKELIKKFFEASGALFCARPRNQRQI